MNEAEIWRAHADKDLAAVRVLLNNGLNGLAAFHAQQAVEKALKARLLARQGNSLASTISWCWVKIADWSLRKKR